MWPSSLLITLIKLVIFASFFQFQPFMYYIFLFVIHLNSYVLHFYFLPLSFFKISLFWQPFIYLYSIVSVFDLHVLYFHIRTFVYTRLLNVLCTYFLTFSILFLASSRFKSYIFALYIVNACQTLLYFFTNFCNISLTSPGTIN